MLVYICFLLFFTYNLAYKSDDMYNASSMAIAPGKTNTSKLWFHYLETSINQTLTDGWSRNVLTSYKLLSSKTHRMVDWCVISTSDADSLKEDDVIHTYKNETAPCGYVKVVNGIQPSITTFYLRTIRQLVVQVSFLRFHMDSFSEDCEHVSSVQLCLTYPSHWECPKSIIFCGYRKPWIQTTAVSLVEVSIVQLNVRYPCNLTFTYTSIEKQLAYVYMKYERVETMHILSNAMDFMPLFTERLVGYYGKWRLQQILGNIIHFMYWQACCFVGSVEIYDGFESYHLIVQKKISNYSEAILDVATTYYLATLIFNLNHTLNNSNDDALFVLRFVKELVNVQFIDTDNFSTTINNHGNLLHKILTFNMTNGRYPNLSVVVRTFKGWNDNMCSFGGYSFKIHIKSMNHTYDQGPFCNGQAPSVPFVGTHGPKHIVFGSFQYYFTIYAFSPSYNIDIDVIIHRSFCEGVFHMCASVIQSYNNQPRENHKLMSYISTSNYGIFCSAISKFNKGIKYTLEMVNIRQCVIFQINSLLPSNAQVYSVRAIMNMDVTIIIGPKHLSEYNITASIYMKLYFSTTVHATNGYIIKSSHRSSHKNVISQKIDLREIRQRLGLYVTSVFEVIDLNRSCSRLQSSRRYSRQQKLFGKPKFEVVDISSYCKKFLFVNQLFYIFRFQMSEQKINRIHYMYSYFEPNCISGSFNSLTARYKSRIYHSVLAIYKRLHLSHCLMSVTYMFYNRNNCSFILEYRITGIILYVKAKIFSTRFLFVSTIPLGSIL